MFPRCEDGFRSPSQLRQRLKAARLARSAAHPGEPLKIEGLLIIFRAERKREAARFLLVCFGMPFAALPGPPQAFPGPLRTEKLCSRLRKASRRTLLHLATTRLL